MKIVYYFRNPVRWEACFTGEPLPPPENLRWPNPTIHHYYNRFGYDDYMSPEQYINLREHFGHGVEELDPTA